jgi:hypothetical protein
MMGGIPTRAQLQASGVRVCVCMIERVREARMEVVTLGAKTNLGTLMMGMERHTRCDASAFAAADPVHGTSSGNQSSTRACLP